MKTAQAIAAPIPALPVCRSIHIRSFPERHCAPSCGAPPSFKGSTSGPC